jgi:peptide/nickel transport system substrate-binding protein
LTKTVVLLLMLLLVPIISFTMSSFSFSYSQLSGSISGSNSNNINTNNIKKGAFVDQINFIHYLDENLALQELSAGKIDTYFYNVPTSIVSDINDHPNLKAYESTGKEDNLLLNPAAAKSSATTGNFNPFSIKQVRFAMNYLIDRNFVVNEILKGHGTPMVDPYGIYSPEYLNIIDTVQSFGFRHDPAIAAKMMSDALMHAGATKHDSGNGKWMYHGKPITVKILIRSDIPDLNSIGNTVASDLQNMGFNVIRDYGDRTKAVSVVYGSDPQDLSWNIYTESTSGTAFLKYDPYNIASSYAPWNSNMPGAQNPSFWNYKNTTLDTITQKLVLGNFTSENERNNLLRAAVKDGIQESVRVYIATLSETHVATKNVKGLVNDFGAGITGRLSLINARLSLINARLEDTNNNNRTNMNVGVKQIYGGAWNNIAGFKDIYSTNIISGIQDPATYYHPYTGETIPFRTPWIDIQTNGPHGAIPIVAGTVIWDPVHQQWKKSGSVGNHNAFTAISKVTYNLLYGKWHNGVMMDKNDVLYANYFQHEWATNTGTSDKTVDSEYSSQVAPSLKFDRGIRFLSDNKLESYTDFWHFDKNEIAGFSIWWPTEPWEITTAEERLVTEGKFTFSKTDSTSKSVDWLSLLVPGHANAVKDELQKMKSERYVPIALRGTVGANEAIKRYDASIKWITQHNNAIIGNGPFYLDGYNPSGGVTTIKAFRDNSYPFSLGYWKKYEHPKLATIETAVSNIPRIIHVGQPSNMVIHVNVDGKPSNNATLRYYLSNTDGKIVASGIAKEPMTISSSNHNGNMVGKYIIQLSKDDTRRLSRGPNMLELFVVSFDAYKPYVVTKSIIAV